MSKVGTMIWKSASKCQSGECVEVGWHKAGASGAQNCVEVGTTLGKSSYSNGGDMCVEAGPCACGGDVLVRDTKNRSGPVLSFTPDEWRAFIAGVKDGEFDI